ncbi:hypothetical protein [Pseudomonas monteilii]|uniref:hypothetical protein n=1 Tax=Pseudomonas monteilii TaxID=76759 RepID=UPI0018A61D8C|nr:hypothetical protein [Pseudomonas monteilii]BBV96437.1 hypothetical protein STW0522PSE72_17880 [Pseudomonas monteilii]
MTPEQAERIMEIYEGAVAEKMAYLRRAHKAEQSAIAWKALALTGWAVLGMALLLGVMP